MRKNVTNQEFEFSSLSDMYKFLTSDNVDDFLIDFGSMLKNAVSIRETVIEQLKQQDMFEINIEDVLDINYFTWIDDGEHDESKFNVKIED